MFAEDRFGLLGQVSGRYDVGPFCVHYLNLLGRIKQGRDDAQTSGAGYGQSVLGLPGQIFFFKTQLSLLAAKWGLSQTLWWMLSCEPRQKGQEGLTLIPIRLIL